MVKKFLPRSLAAASGGLVLWLLHLALDPVPVAAGPAYALGAACLLFPTFDRRGRVLNLAALIGAGAGALVHRAWHLGGQSPPPAEGLGRHLFHEGLIGFLAALLALGLAVFVFRWLMASSRGTPSP